MRVVDISNPRDPHEVGDYDTPGYAKGISLNGDYAYIADRWGGLRVVDINDPLDPYEIGYYVTSGSAIDIAISDDGLIYVADWSNLGIYRFADPNAVDGSKIFPPNEFSLHPPYPNPFNSSTRLTYSIPKPGLVTLKLFDIAGRQVRLLDDGYRKAGRYGFTLQAGELPSGEYILQVSCDKKQEHQKLLLLK